MQLNPFAVSGLLTGMSSVLFGLFVYSREPGKKLYRLWLLFTLSVSIWGFGGFAIGLARDSGSAVIFWRVAYIGVIFIPALFYHFVIVFLGLRRLANLAAVYILSSCFLIIDTTLFLIPNTTWMFNQLYFLYPRGPAYSYFVLYFFVMVVVSHAELLFFMKNTQDDLKKTQVKWFLMATVIGFAGGATCFLPSFGIRIYPYGNFTVFLYPIIMSYAILRHQLMDIKVVIQKTFFYTFWTLVLSVFYALTIVLIQALLSGKGFFGISGWREFEILIYRWSGVLALLTNAGLGVFVWVRNPKSAICRKFFFLSICIGFWAVGSWLVNIISNQAAAFLVLRFDYAFGVFVPVLFLSFIGTLTEKKLPSALIRSGYFISIVLAACLFLTPQFIKGLRLIQGYDFYISQPGPIYGVFVAYFCVYFLTAFDVLIRALRHADPGKTAQLGYVLIAYVIGMAAGCEYFLSVYGILRRPPLDDYILAVTFGILSYAISRHSLLDIKIVIRKTVFYSLLAFTISTAYVFIVFIAHKFFIGDSFTRQHLIASLVLILFITLLLRPAEHFLRKRLDKRFFKGTIEEISEQKAMLETELERRERLRSVGVLAAGMAHEIKNPITAIRTFAEFLPKKHEDPEFRERFSKLLVEETDRISKIVRDLLLFAKPSEPMARPCDLAEILEGITDLLKGDLLKYSIELELDCPAKIACVADPSQIKQAFLNIIMNAIDAMREEKGERRLKISLSEAEKYAHVIIEDTGEGIAPERLPHLFDPFYTNKEDGTGLGLAITHSILEKNHGKIEVESVVGRGTRFKILVPMYAQ